MSGRIVLHLVPGLNPKPLKVPHHLPRLYNLSPLRQRKRDTILTRDLMVIDRYWVEYYRQRPYLLELM